MTLAKHNRTMNGIAIADNLYRQGTLIEVDPPKGCYREMLKITGKPRMYTNMKIRVDVERIVHLRETLMFDDEYALLEWEQNHLEVLTKGKE